MDMVSFFNEILESGWEW